MRLKISHQTVYRYTQPASYSIQQLRLTPRAEPFCLVAHWHIAAPAKLSAFTDTFGNVAHTLVLKESHHEIRLSVEGEVLTDALAGGVLPAESRPLPVGVFQVSTPLTEPNAAIVALGAGISASTASASQVLELARSIQAQVVYVPGSTQVHSTAAQALAQAQGVCQDHAHLMLSACRAQGLPARYVSGYVDPGNSAHAASHAWVDVWLASAGHWISVDVTNGEFATDTHCRLAVGRDYDSAAPVRGVRRGGGVETMQVDVQVGQ